MLIAPRPSVKSPPFLRPRTCACAYKNSSHEGSGAEAFPGNERERYRDQLERYRRMLTALENRRIRMGLYFPLLNGWREVEETSSGDAVAQGTPAAWSRDCIAMLPGLP
jgi:hypothetical protein